MIQTHTLLSLFLNSEFPAFKLMAKAPKSSRFFIPHQKAKTSLLFFIIFYATSNMSTEVSCYDNNVVFYEIASNTDTTDKTSISTNLYLNISAIFADLPLQGGQQKVWAKF